MNFERDLTKRELENCNMLAKGLSRERIGKLLLSNARIAEPSSLT